MKSGTAAVYNAM